MTSELNNTWHLATNEDEQKIAELEMHLWRIYQSFIRWQEDCQRYACGICLSNQEIAMLHIVRMKNRPKTIYEVGRLLNRDDPNNIQYGLGKLIKHQLIERSVAAKKALTYQITDKGMAVSDRYAQARQEILIPLFKGFGFDKLQLEQLTQSLNHIKSLYDEATRRAAMYSPEVTTQEPELV